MKRCSPDAGRRRSRRRDVGAVADVAPLCATGVFAAATLAIATFTAPALVRGTATTPADACTPLASAIARADDDARG